MGEIVKQEMVRTVSGADPIKGVRSIRIASWLFLGNGVAWGLYSIPFAVYLDRLGRLPIIGLPIVGPIHGMGGPISRRFGVEGVVWFLMAMGLLVWTEVLAGWWLRRRRKGGGWLAIFLFPVSMFFWIGFELPIWIAMGPTRVALVLLGWKALR